MHGQKRRGDPYLRSLPSGYICFYLLCEKITKPDRGTATKKPTHTNDPDLLKENKKKIKELNKKLKDEKKKNRDIDPTDPSQAPLPC